MLLTWAPGVLRNAGLQVVETAGWTSRSHGDFPESISGVWHHDASPPGDSPGALQWMISNWNNASANFWVDRYGKWYCVGAGVAYHAGSTLPGMPGNKTAFGVETDQTINETPSAALLDSTRRGFAALLKYMDRSSNSLHFHKTIATPPGRKQDPWLGPLSGNRINWPGELNAERNRIQSIMDGTPEPAPEPEPPGEDMAATLALEINGTLNLWVVDGHNRLWQKWEDGNQPSGWTDWTLGTPGEWLPSGMSIILRGSNPQLFGVNKDGKTVQSIWSDGKKWNGPVPFAGVEAG